MNLKEAFRYQNFLNVKMNEAGSSIYSREHSLKTTKRHMCSKVNNESEDFEEEVTPAEAFYPNDDVIQFMQFLCGEKKRLSEAITEAKQTLPFDIDAAVALNRSKQAMCGQIKMMLRHKSSRKIEAAVGHKFNVEGNQVDYRYDVEVVAEEAFDREKSRMIMKNMAAECDEVSSRIDAAKVNTQVDYSPTFDVNDTFEEAMETFLAM